MHPPDEHVVREWGPSPYAAQSEDVPVGQDAVTRAHARTEGWGDLPRDDIYKAIRWLAKISATALVLGFGYLQLSGSDWSTIGSSVTADVIFKVALALYYAS